MYEFSALIVFLNYEFLFNCNVQIGYIDYNIQDIYNVIQIEFNIYPHSIVVENYQPNTMKNKNIQYYISR